MLAPFRALAAAALLAAPGLAPAAEPLHVRIDRHIAAGVPDFKKKAAPLTGDEEFVRRAYLDLAGTVPAVAELNQFLTSPEPDKRAKLVDRLLAAPGYARRMAWHFDVMLMERRPDAKVPRAAWEAYLRVAFSANRPYDRFVRDLLAADGADPNTRPAAKFFLDRDLEPHLVTRDLGRVFLGRDLQCAQCHDHPSVDGYRQAEYYGIQAFLNRSFLSPDAQAAGAVIAERAEGDVSFMSVFDKDKKQHTALPRIAGVRPVEEPKPVTGQEPRAAPNAVAKPANSRRARLAGAVTSPENAAFARNIANRMWALMMGRGIVHPLDWDHEKNPPSHPELLDELARELVARGYDLKWLVREIALSEAYQRSSERPADADAPEDRYLVAILKPLSPEQFAYAVMQATGHTDAERDAIKKLGPKATEEMLDGRLAPRLVAFRRALGGRPGDAGETFSATLDQTLFLKYGAAVRGLLPARAGNLADRLRKTADPDAVATELFAAVLSRRPTADERQDIADALTGSRDRQTTLNELVWAMVASAEFRFNH
ncbi:DUF1549 and DUF1553 domain-containing protein [Gemmata sp. JC673]|uniref:DUF1549 and DUF1553 domain-containing protein n=1 Tax=Gemmata algarum TaxID=2975278 RepID=A0ABU5F4D5_9BACT|nr:DUF1549 domain-containing protein [Gemmata algarum]MDY3562428.1 DUF1549 and DUF1553 domain-containing protein [Gemmata algarum]